MAVTQTTRARTATAASELNAPGSQTGGQWCVAVLCIFLLITAGVSVGLRMPGVVPRGNETTWDRAIFTSLNAATLTGFQQSIGLRQLSVAGGAGPDLIFALTIIGSFMTLFVGGVASARVLRMPARPGQIALAAISSQALAMVVGAAILSSTDLGVFPALFQSGCAFGNCGLWLSGSPSGFALSTFVVLLPLALLGGLGLPVLIELFNATFARSKLSHYSKTVLKLTAMLYLAAFAVLFVSQISAAWGGGWNSWRSTVTSASVEAVNTRTAGIPFESPSAFTPAGQWMLMVLMMIGAAPAGTAGGLKITTLWQLITGTRDALAGRPAGRATGIAAVWLLLYATVLFAGIVLLAGSESQISADRLIFLAISALSNVGLSHDPISITGPGLLVLSGLMLAGRLMPLAILWWMARTAQGAEVLVG